MRTILPTGSQLHVQKLYAHETVCSLSLEILEFGKCNEEECCVTYDPMNEVLLECVIMVRELFREGEGVGQGGEVVA
jgi:hypothetical protein